MHVEIFMVYKILRISWYVSNPTKINPQNLHSKPNSSSPYMHVPLTLPFNAYTFVPCNTQYDDACTCRSCYGYLSICNMFLPMVL